LNPGFARTVDLDQTEGRVRLIRLRWEGESQQRVIETFHNNVGYYRFPSDVVNQNRWAEDK
jgi:hypothetical protein